MIRDPASFQILLDTIARFVREKLIPREPEVTETDEIPADIMAEMRRMGLFGLTIPEAYGGLGLTTEEEALSSMALCEASPVFRSIMGTNNGIGGMGIVIDGTDAQKKKYLPGIAEGSLRLQAFGVTEPTTGSNTLQLKTTAVRQVFLLIASPECKTRCEFNMQPDRAFLSEYVRDVDLAAYFDVNGVHFQNEAVYTTTMRAMDLGAPVDLVFQSIAGTEAANASFGVTLDLLAEARAAAAAPARPDLERPLWREIFWRQITDRSAR